ncbi:MAG TPA: hypothetical protein ENN21_03370 [Spirochaetes bacterium]|nr:hypothetical protein [Spirochaetota bacterium]
MTTTTEYQKCGADLERLLLLKTSPIAVKMLKSEADIPEGAFRPKRDKNVHYAQCQAFALSRREKMTVAMLAADNWCFAPPIAYGLVDRPDNPEFEFFTDFPRFERGRYIGIVSAPLKSADFEPDIVITYCNPVQLRNLLQPLHFARRADEVMCNFFPPVCSQAVVTVLETGKFLVAVPDPGEAMRACPADDELIISAPASKMAGLVEALQEMFKRGASGHVSTPILMQADYEQPPMYQALFRQWGILEED